MLQDSKHFFFGIHVFGEMFGIAGESLNDPELLEAALKKGIASSGATLCDIQIKRFDPSGVTLLALLSESHASIHTYPEFGSLFFDAFTCGDHCKPQKIADELAATLKAERSQVQSLRRGNIEQSRLN